MAVNLNLILTAQILTKTKKLVLYFNTSQAIQTNKFFINCLHQQKSKEEMMRRNVLLSVYNRATYLHKTQAIM